MALIKYPPMFLGKRGERGTVDQASRAGTRVARYLADKISFRENYLRYKQSILQVSPGRALMPQARPVLLGIDNSCNSLMIIIGGSNQMYSLALS